MTGYTIPVRVTYNADVYVEAESAEEALEKAEAGTWTDDGRACAERTDWTVTGSPRKEA